MTQPPPPQEQIPLTTILEVYRNKIQDLLEANVILEARLLERARIDAELSSRRDLPDTPHQ